MGVRNKKDLVEDISCFSSPVDENMIERVNRSFNSMDDQIIDPRLWKKG
jgi:hypothetical protein